MVFPATDPESPEPGLPDALAQLTKGDMLNYESVESNKAEADVELNRYHEKGYTQRIPRPKVIEMYSGGTVLRLALIVKVKENLEVKRRIVIDLRRSRRRS